MPWWTQSLGPPCSQGQGGLCWSFMCISDGALGVLRGSQVRKGSRSVRRGLGMASWVAEIFRLTKPRVGLPQAYPGTVRLESPCPSCLPALLRQRHSHGGPPERHARDSETAGAATARQEDERGPGPPPPPRLAGEPRQASQGHHCPHLVPAWLLCGSRCMCPPAHLEQC